MIPTKCNQCSFHSSAREDSPFKYFCSTPIRTGEHSTCPRDTTGMKRAVRRLIKGEVSLGHYMKGGIVGEPLLEGGD